MGIVSRLLGGVQSRNASPYVQAFLRGDDMPNAWGAGGRAVSEADALSVVAVFAAVRVIAETIATLPLHLYRRLQPRGRERATEHPLYWLLHDDPNPEMTHTAFWESIIGHAVLRGTAYAEIQRNEDNRVQALWPLRPDRMRMDRTAEGQLVYFYRHPDGQEKPYRRGEILTVPGFGGDGYQGYSVVRLHAEAIGLALDSQAYAARFFRNDSRPGGVLQTPGQLSDEAFDRLKKSWEEAHRGVENAHRVAILEEGTTWQAVAMSSRDAQFLEQRRFSVEEVARMFRLPPHTIGDLSRSTFTNIEHQGLELVTLSLRPWAVRVEEAVERCLLSAAERRTHYIEHLVDGLLRGDIQTRYAAYSVSKQNGWNSANDIRELENQNPIPADQGGDTYMVQLNMTPAGLLGQDPGGTGQDPGGTGQRQQRAVETRAGGSAASRLRIARSHRRLFVNAVERLVRREAAEVTAAAERHLNRRDAASFLTWLREYYQGFGAVATRTLLPVLLAFADVVLDDAAAEIGSDDPMAEALQDFIAGIARTFGEHYAGQSLGQLAQQVRLAEDRGEDPLDAVTTRLGEWAETRPDKVADIEQQRLLNAVTRERWRRGGVRLIVWVRQGGTSCPFCVRLDGKTVGIEQEFARDGDEIEGDEQSGPLRVDRPTRHPPIHATCKCGLRPERG